MLHDDREEFVASSQIFGDSMNVLLPGNDDPSQGQVGQDPSQVVQDPSQVVQDPSYLVQHPVELPAHEYFQDVLNDVQGVQQHEGNTAEDQRPDEVQGVQQDDPDHVGDAIVPGKVKRKSRLSAVFKSPQAVEESSAMPISSEKPVSSEKSASSEKPVSSEKPESSNKPASAYDDSSTMPPTNNNSIMNQQIKDTERDIKTLDSNLKDNVLVFFFIYIFKKMLILFFFFCV